MFPCYSLHSSHPLLPPLGPQVCSLCLHLHCCPANKLISTIFLDSIYMLMYNIYLFFSFWLTSLCRTGSRFIHVTRTDSNSFIFMAESYSILHMYYNFFIHSCVDWHLDCFQVLAIVNSAAVNSGVHVSFRIVVFLGYMPSSLIAWRRQWHPTPVLLPGKSHGQRSLVGCSPWGR